MAAGSNPVLIVQIRTALNCAVDFNERVTVFTTGTACTLANGRIFSHGPWKVTVGIGSVLNRLIQRRPILLDRSDLILAGLFDL